MKFFSSFRGAYNRCWLAFFFSILKGLDDIPSFLGFVLLIKLSFCILFSSSSSAHLSQERLQLTDSNCSGEASLPRLLIKHETC